MYLAGLYKGAIKSLVRIYWLFPLASACVVVSSWAGEGEFAPAPSWSHTYDSVGPNGSFLANYGRRPNSLDPDLNDQILERNRSLQLRQQYEDMTRRHRFYRNYENDHDMVSCYEDQRMGKEMGQFGRYISLNIASYQVNEGFKKAEKNSENVRTFRQVQQGVGSVAHNNTSVQLDPRFRFGTRANIPAQKGQVWMQSAVVDGELDVLFGKPWPYDPFSPDLVTGKIDQGGRDDQYQVNISRVLPIWELRSGVTYGGTTTNVRTYVQKQLTPELSCELASKRSVDPGRPGANQQGEKLVQFRYGIRF